MTVPRLYFLDVGQGHATVVADRTEFAVIDCPRAGVSEAAHLARSATAVDVFITHRDLDHCGGVPQLFDVMHVRSVTMNYSYALPPETDAKRRVKAVLRTIFDRCEQAGFEPINRYSGSKGSVGRVRWEILAPSATNAGRATLDGNANRASLIIHFSYESRSALITGDADDAALRLLMKRHGSLPVDILLVPHHGAALECFDDLLRATDPSLVIVSFGRGNRYGHPDVRILQHAARRCGIMCTEVARLCHSGSLDSPSCAGTVGVVLDERLSTSTGVTSHSSVIDGLDSPVCRTAGQQVGIRSGSSHPDTKRNGR